ncbi:MAG: hypothetical protein QXU99_00270 [Candidatus Bathyarchaeia archaeon]
MPKKLIAAATLIFLLLLVGIIAVQLNNEEKTSTESNMPFMAMPEEYINYTIIRVNGKPWAKVDGIYPIQTRSWTNHLMMVYPIPPGTINITITMDENQLEWSNFTELYPNALHYTALGNWTMISCILNRVPEYFTLKIHYEHPLVLINGSYTFLYDLNIRDYLSSISPRSTAYFTIHMKINYENLKVKTIATDGKITPINYTTKTNNIINTITFQVISEYGKPLLGDILGTFTEKPN